MPTVRLNVAGLEYSPNDEVDSVSKLHNFTIGADKTIYKLPVLKNLKNTISKQWAAPPNPTYDNITLPYRLLDIKKFDTSGKQNNILPPELTPSPIGFIENTFFKRLIYLTQNSYGVINIDDFGNRVYNSDINQQYKVKFGEFEYSFEGTVNILDMDSLTPRILVDSNSIYNETPPYDNTNQLRCVFPAQYQFPNATPNNYDLMLMPRNILNCIVEASDIIQQATATPPDILPLTLEDSPTTVYNSNDLARGCLAVANRMVYYSAYNNRIYISKPANFRVLAKDPDNPTMPFSIVPTESIQNIAEFNGNLITFTPSGIDRWVFSGNIETVLERDATFHYDYRIRYNGSYVVANNSLYFYTDDLKVYRLNSDLSLQPIFDGILPSYSPLQALLDREQELPMSTFNMLGYRFVTIGPWLYNLDSKVWSTYNFDGYKQPTNTDTSRDFFVYGNDGVKQMVVSGYDNIICTYSTICRPLSYKEMADETIFNDTQPSLIEGQHQWGEVAFFTTKIYQAERMFNITALQLNVAGGSLQRGAIVWAKILLGSELGDFDLNNESDYGVPAQYEPLDAAILGESDKAYVGRFSWTGINLQTDRFRVQIITKEKRGLVIGEILANIVTIPEVDRINTLPTNN